MKQILLSFGFVLTTCGLWAQDCTDVFISEYVEGTFNNKAIELYNPTSTPINLTSGNYKMGRDRDGAGNPMLLAITGVIPPYGTRVFALDKRDPNGTGQEAPLLEQLMAAADTFLNPVYVQSFSPMYFNGDDAFVLVKGTATILDIIGKIGEDPGGGWWEPGDPNTRWWTTDNTLIRKASVKKGVYTNPVVFNPALEWDSLPVNTFDFLGLHECDCQESVGVNELRQTEFRAFPNPIARGELSLKANKEFAGYALRASTGQLIARQEGLSGANYLSLQIPQPAPGVYLIEVWFTDGSRLYHKLLAK
jgi:hypothetical protein